MTKLYIRYDNSKYIHYDNIEYIRYDKPMTIEMSQYYDISIVIGL